jgi:hypothetical protein
MKKIFKKKNCESCGKIFTPTTGVQKRCKYCFHHCQRCGAYVKNKGRILILTCKNCFIPSERIYIGICSGCGESFNNINGLKSLCVKCDPYKGVCLECGIKISKKAIRCNSCERESHYGYKIGDVVTFLDNNNKERNKIKIGKNEWKFYSIWVWEQHNGDIKNGNVIHHINKNSKDDRIENLQELTREEHIKLHYDDLW